MNQDQLSNGNGSHSRSNVHPFNILVWNVQGAGGKEFLNIMKEHIRVHKPRLIALVETRISGARAQAICTRIGFNKSLRVEAQGFQGGIWVLWNPEEIQVDPITLHDQYVTVEIRYNHHTSWLISFVYASPHTQRREVLWHELSSFAAECHRLWRLLVGDFNDTISLEERNHVGSDTLRHCTRFKQWIENSGLIDLGFYGPKFTWARGLHPILGKRLC